MSGRIWLEILVAWAASIPISGFFYAAHKFRPCKGRYRFFLMQGFVFIFFFALLGASFLFPSVFSSDGMQSVLTFSFFALPITTIVGALLLRRFETSHPEEIELSRRVEEDWFR